MDREQMLTMDSYILLSIINMKLRDRFASLEDLCEDYDISKDEIKEKLKNIGFIYDGLLNQFITV